MSQKAFRAPAVPLVTHDPFFNVWSFGSRLAEDATRHWDGVRKYMVGLLTFDGVPLDSRCDNTKTDWQMWSTKLFDNPEYTGMVVNAMWRYLHDCTDGVPFSDLNYVSKPYMRGFQARTVQAGLFINLLQL